jgi:hypothetical protein
MLRGMCLLGDLGDHALDHGGLGSVTRVGIGITTTRLLLLELSSPCGGRERPGTGLCLFDLILEDLRCMLCGFLVAGEDLGPLAITAPIRQIRPNKPSPRPSNPILMESVKTAYLRNHRPLLQLRRRRNPITPLLLIHNSAHLRSLLANMGHRRSSALRLFGFLVSI